jgi:hypothetical protein
LFLPLSVVLQTFDFFGLFTVFYFPMFGLWNCLTVVFQYFVYSLSF